MKMITKSFVANLRPSAADVDASKRRQIYDENLSVVILPSGRLTFYVYSTKGGKRQYKRLMSLPDNKIDDRQLQILNGDYRKYWSNIHYEIGHRPQDIQEAANKEAREQWERIKLVTLQDILDLYMKGHGSHTRNGSKTKRLIEIHFSNLLMRGVEDIQRSEVSLALLAIPQDTTSNRARGALRTVINWAYDGSFIQSRNCVEQLPKPRPEKPRQRTASDEEIRKLWLHLSPLHKLLLATGQRLEDAQRMNWGDLDPISREWLNPTTKTGKVHSLIVTQGLVKRLPERVEGSDAVFNSARGVRVSLNQAQQWFTNSTAAAGIKGLTGHDLRRTALAAMADLGDIYTTERVANHAFGNVQKRYILKDYSKDKKELLGKWWTRMGNILHPKGWEAMDEIEHEQVIAAAPQ